MRPSTFSSKRRGSTLPRWRAVRGGLRFRATRRSASSAASILRVPPRGWSAPRSSSWTSAEERRGRSARPSRRCRSASPFASARAAPARSSAFISPTSGSRSCSTACSCSTSARRGNSPSRPPRTASTSRSKKTLSRKSRGCCGNAEPIALENPIAAQLEVMRSSMIGSLVANLRFNLARKLERVRVFEAGRCFLRSSDGEDPGDPAKALPGYYQPLRLAGLAYGPAAAEQWGTPARRVDFYDVKADIEALLAPRGARFTPLAHPGLHPGRAASVSLDETVIGWIGELHPRWQQKYELPQPAVLFELEAEALTIAATPHYREISKFPPVIRDRAVVVDEGVSARGLLEEMDRIRSPLVQDIRLFDV